MISSLDFVTSAIFGPYFFQHISWQDLDDYINIERVYPELVSKALSCASVEMNDCTTSVTSCKDADDFCILSKKEGNRKEALKTRLYSIMPWFTLRLETHNYTESLYQIQGLIPCTFAHNIPLSPKARRCGYQKSVLWHGNSGRIEETLVSGLDLEQWTNIQGTNTILKLGFTGFC